MASQQIQQAVIDALSDPMNLPSTFWDYATQNWLKDAPVFPISQVFGFTQYAAQFASIVTTESTSSTSYADLATSGPTISNLADGKYVLFYWVQCLPGTASHTMSIGVNINGNAPLTADTVGVTFSPNASNDNYFTLFGGSTVSLSNNGSNTIKLQYKTSANSTSFQSRYLFALRYGNL